MASPAEAAASVPAILLQKVCKTYDLRGVPVPALREIDLRIDDGEFVAVMGRSGSGKSTLLHVLGLLDSEYEGSYRLGGRLMSGSKPDALAEVRSREIGFVFQAFHLLPGLTLLDNVALPALYARDRSPEACRAAARARLEELGLAERLSHRPHQVSIGQRQRAAIARALVNRPRVLLADEPTGALDSRTAGEILEILGRLHREGATLVLVTHDREVAAVAQRVVQLRDGQLLEGVA